MTTSATTSRIAELEQDRASAVSRLDDAKSAVRSAEAAFDADPSKTALAALTSAQEEVRIAEKFVERAERVLAHAEQAAAAEARRELEGRRQTLAQELSHTAVAAAVAPLEREEAAALLAVAQVRAKRLAMTRDYATKARDLYQVDKQLGTVDAPLTDARRDQILSPQNIEAALREFITSENVAIDAASLLEALVPKHRDYEPRQVPARRKDG